MRSPHSSRALVVAAVSAVVLPLGVSTAVAGERPPDRPGDVPAAESRELRVSVVSSRPDAVSGGDALVRVDLPPGVRPERVRVSVDGEDVSGDLRPTDGGLLGLVDGLTPGGHTIRASARGAGTGAVDVTAHPGTGPVFSGPQEEPFVCETAEFATVTGQVLGEPLDEDCSVTPRVEYVYRTTAGTFQPLADPAALPADVATTTTLEGVVTPYVVRVETGTVNRGVYEFAVLHDPGEGVDPSPFARNRAWNDRLVHTLGGGCRGGWYRQGAATGGVLVDPMLSRGFAVASNSLNVFGNNCSDLLTSETLSTTREEFIETHGVPTYTMGWGCSGGSYQAHQAVDAYPGLLDGMVVGCSFPDVGFATSQKLADARLLHHYSTVTAPAAMDEAQELAVAGFGVHAAIANQSTGAQRLDPQAEFDPSVPQEERYDPQSNPDGARATVWDHTRNAYGVDPRTGSARRPLDNVGVQYGLQALADGTIGIDQFLDLNDRIGGLDTDAGVVADRMSADPLARRAAYETGRMLDGGGLADVPIIDYRAYTDDLPVGDIHMRYHSFSTRERLIEANGDADNQVMLVEDDTLGLFSPDSPVLVSALEQMDRWILAVQATVGSGDDRHDVVVAAKPADLVEACFAPDGTKIVEEQVYRGDTRCNRLYPSFASPRIVAGGPLASDVVTCQLREPSQGDYPEMTDGQWAQLRDVFPTGVCDYTRPGVDETGRQGTWAFFDAPGEWTFHEPVA
ncbi:hypothetical protein SAMN06893096_10520 [Geodermatophilus pulveris]|uniref:DUF6351 domain-containing protein n=1 Tax=Geodermatophilus pulveris TaxID=1564159 RepID=A0A239FDW1_9ACTN|nr:DUF6351 family protein [Geodermatophilus pulveris]SNS54493.1 hypothetical protein SAMN06893096_10520 [Geodermatophilus pulveris]